MLARHLPLLWTFAGGCLSGAALIVFWPAGPAETESVLSPQQQRVARSSETISPPVATSTGVREPALPEDARDALPEDARDALPDDAAEPRAEPGSSVADVLVRLENEYRQRLSGAAPASAGRELPTDAPPTAVSAPVPANTENTATVAAAAPPQASAPQVNAVAHPVTAPEAERVAVLAARGDAEPRNVNVNVHVGDTNQSNHVGDVYEGNVVLVQQPAVYGYPQLVAPPRARVAPSTHVGVGYPQYPTHGATPRRTPTFASSWTVPNDRLGYDSALIPMLK